MIPSQGEQFSELREKWFQKMFKDGCFTFLALSADTFGFKLMSNKALDFQFSLSNN